MYVSPQKSHAADILGEDHDTKTPKKRAAEKWGSAWDQSTDSVSQADTEFVQQIQNPWASLVANIRFDRHNYKIVEMKFWKNHKTWQVLSFSWLPPNSLCKNSLFTLL